MQPPLPVGMSAVSRQVSSGEKNAIASCLPLSPVNLGSMNIMERYRNR